MGTRLTIEDEDGNILFYGTKFYGYTDIRYCKSTEYLWRECYEELSKDFDDFEEFVEHFEYVFVTAPMCKMTIPQLMGFIKAYDEDLAEHGWDYRVSDNIKPIPPGVEFVWLSWG